MLGLLYVLRLVILIDLAFIYLICVWLLYVVIVIKHVTSVILILKILKVMETKFRKKAFVIEVILGAELNLYQLLAPSGAPVLITDDTQELIDFLNSDPAPVNVSLSPNVSAPGRQA